MVVPEGKGLGAPECCGICGAALNQGTNGSVDCGGDCLACVSEVEAWEGYGLPEIEGGWQLVEWEAIRLWIARSPEALLDHDSPRTRHTYNDAMPYWAWLWESAAPMTRALASRGMEGTVLEVGAGLGAVGLGLAAANPNIELTLSDNDPQSVATLAVNALLNRLPEIRVWTLDWRQPGLIPEESFNAIIGCEVTYDAPTHEPLLDVFDRFLAPRDGRVLLTDAGRPRLPQFIRRAEARGWSVQIQTMDGQDAPPAAGEARLLTLTR